MVKYKVVGESMTELFAADIKNIDLTDETCSLVSPERRKRIERMTSEAGKKLCLAAGLLISRVIGAPELVTDKGKPYAEGKSSFSISHSGDIAVLAVSAQPVGIDIEKRADRDIIKLAARAFHEDEQKRLKSAQDKKREFFKIWTMKESLVKAWGTGFDREPSSFSVFDDNGFNFFVREYAQGYTLCVCTKDRDINDIIFLEF